MKTKPWKLARGEISAPLPPKFTPLLCRDWRGGIHVAELCGAEWEIVLPDGTRVSWPTGPVGYTTIPIRFLEVRP